MSQPVATQLLTGLTEQVWDVPDRQRWVLPLMRACGPGLVNTLWRLLGNEQDVLDAYQECFCRLASSNRKVTGHRGRAYVYRTGVNIALDMLRRRSVVRLHEASYRHHRRQIQNPADPIADLSHEELLGEMRRAILQLPKNLQQVLVLRDLGEFSYAKVAKILGITSGTARVYRHLAVRQLAGSMDARPGGACDA